MDDQTSEVAAVGDAVKDDLEEVPTLVDLFQGPEETVCEFGDITLFVDDGFHPPQKIRVSSCILATSSKVFRMMLSKRYAEGQSISAGSVDVMLRDAPRPLLSLCKLLHHMPVTLYDRTPTTINDELLDLALIIDKYDCVTTLTAATYTLLSRLSRFSEAWVLRYDYMAASAYILDHADLFREYTKKMVLDYSTVPPMHAHCFELLPSDFSAKLCAQQTFVQQDLTLSITEIIDDFTTAAYTTGKPNLVCELMREMRLHGLWPLRMRSLTLSDYINSLSAVRVPVLLVDEDTPCVRTGWGSVRSRQASPDYMAQQSWRFRASGNQNEAPNHLTSKRAADRFQDYCVGLCLDCLRGRQECGVSHPEPWKKWEKLATRSIYDDAEDQYVESVNGRWDQIESTAPSGWLNCW